MINADNTRSFPTPYSSLRRLQALLSENNWDALLLTSPAGRRYATGFTSSAGMVLVTRDAGFLYTDSRYIEAARARAAGFTVELIEREQKYQEQVGARLSAYGVRTLGFEQGVMTVSQFRTLGKAWPDAAFCPAQSALNALRMVKTDEEIARMRAAQHVAETAYNALLPMIRTGLTEKQVRAELIYQMYLAGADGLSFDPIVVSGPNTALPHGEATGRVLQPGDFLLMDFGVIFQGYCSDTTRTAALGHVTEEMRRVYDVVLCAQLAGIAAARAGVMGAGIHKAAADVIADAGYGAYFGHGFGHGIGLEVHESGGAAPSAAKTPLPAGTVLSAEPGIYLPGRFGVRIEDVIVLRENGCENLTGLSKELLVL